MRPLPALLLLPLAAALVSDPAAEVWASLTAVQWPPVRAAVYRRLQLASPCLCRAACVADPRCQALSARRLDSSAAACSLARQRRGAPTPVQTPPEEEGGWFERAGPAELEQICWEDARGGCRLPTDCAELRAAGVTASGVYTVSVSDREVFCDMETEDGGWTLLQRRVGPTSDEFTRSLAEYVAGFGDPRGEHWLGLAAAARLSTLHPQQLRVDGWFKGQLWYAVYGPIALDAADGYRLSALPQIRGNSTVVLVPEMEAVFQTCGAENPLLRSLSCRAAGWWTTDPLPGLGTNLNGVLKNGDMVSRWVVDDGRTYYPTRTEMKLKTME